MKQHLIHFVVGTAGALFVATLCLALTSCTTDGIRLEGQACYTGQDGNQVCVGVRPSADGKSVVSITGNAGKGSGK